MKIFVGSEARRGMWLIALTVVAGLCMLVEALADQQLVKGAARGSLSWSLVLLVLSAYAVSYFVALQKMLQRVKLQADTRRVLNSRHFSWFACRPRGNDQAIEEASAAIPLKRTPYYLNYFLDEVFDFIYETVFLVACTAALFFIDWRVGAAVVAFYPVAWGIGRIFGPRLSLITERADKELSRYISNSVDLLRSRRQVLSFDMPMTAFKEMQRTRRVYLRDQRRAKEFECLGRSLQEGAGQLREICLLGVVSMAGRADLSSLFLALYLAGMAAEPVKRWGTHYQSLIGVKGLRIAVRAEEAVVWDPVPIEQRAAGLRYSCSLLTAGDNVLSRGLDLCLTPGLTRIVGVNGAGKSVLLADLIGERAEVQGEISRWDGRPFSRPLECMRLEGETPLFEGTVRDHVTLFEDDINQERWAMVSRYLASLANLSEVSTLSGGERQRVLAARVLYQDPALCVLDEALASMDPEQKLRTLVWLRDQCSGILCVVEHHLSPEAESIFSQVLAPLEREKRRQR